MNSKYSIVLHILPFLLLTESIEVDKCSNYNSCSACLQDPDCAWNLEEYVFDNRCQNRSKAGSKWYDPPTSIHIHNQELSDTIHIQPKTIKLTIRPRLAVGFNVVFKNVHSTVLEAKYTAPEFITVGFETNCNNSTEHKITNKCENVSDGEIYTFKVVIEATCPENDSDFNNQTIRIYQSHSNQSLIIETNILCSCPCESPENVLQNAEKCSRVGTYKCGICECDQGFSGKHCECRGNPDPNECKNPESGLICSNRGSCICGKCECEVLPNPRHNIYGRYCEFDNSNCKIQNGILCGGIGHGNCVSGKCMCYNGWTGPTCTCTTNTDFCRKPGSDSVCSGKGRCVCGVCDCRPGYLGLFCEKGNPNPFLI